VITIVSLSILIDLINNTTIIYSPSIVARKHFLLSRYYGLELREKRGKEGARDGVSVSWEGYGRERPGFI
jgi:hypothetical protein